MKKKYTAPTSLTIELHTEGQILDTSVAKESDQMKNGTDALSNKSNNPWNSDQWLDE